MKDILTIAEEYQEQARKVIEETGIVEIWKSVGCDINLVGSLNTGLLIKNRDVDFHIYSDPFILADSFKAASLLAAKKGIMEIHYNNLLEAEDKCVEWHALYDDVRGNRWKFDMIHILKGSTYDGVFEKVAERIKSVLTEETRKAILEIKYEMPEEKKIMGILIYKAVIKDGVRNYSDFCGWLSKYKCSGIETWMP